MKYCAKCKVTVTGAGTRCPLCQGGLQENGEPDVRGAIFPNIPDTLHKHSLFFRILILVSVAAVVICGVINLILPEHGWWSLFVLAGVGLRLDQPRGGVPLPAERPEIHPIPGGGRLRFDHPVGLLDGMARLVDRLCDPDHLRGGDAGAGDYCTGV